MYHHPSLLNISVTVYLSLYVFGELYHRSSYWSLHAFAGSDIVGGGHKVVMLCIDRRWAAFVRKAIQSH